MSRFRKDAEVVGQRLADVVRTATAQALMMIRSDVLLVDVAGYQKERHVTAVKWAARKFADRYIDFEPALLQVLEVSKRADGSLYVMDGQARLYFAQLCIEAGLLPVDYELPCKVHYGNSIKQEAQIAADINKERRVSSAWEDYNFLLAAEDVTALAMRDRTEECGFKNANYTSPSTVSCHAKVRKWFKRDAGPETYVAALNFIKTVWKGRESSTHGDIIIGAASWFEKHGDDAALVKTLTRKAKRNNPDAILASAKALRGGNSGGSAVPVRKVLESLAGIDN
jgi:hypothetical protein